MAVSSDGKQPDRTTYPEAALLQPRIASRPVRPVARPAITGTVALEGMATEEGEPVDGFYDGYAVVGLVALLGVAFVAVAFGANRLLRPTVPGGDKTVTYECGVDPVGDGWAQSHLRYYVFAYLYVIFAVDAIYLFPWATVFAAPGFGATTLAEMFVFIGFLAVGLLYAWRKGVLTWR